MNQGSMSVGPETVLGFGVWVCGLGFLMFVGVCPHVHYTNYFAFLEGGTKSRGNLNIIAGHQSIDGIPMRFKHAMSSAFSFCNLCAFGYNVCA